jgi:ammonium transporter, Amt family
MALSRKISRGCIGAGLGLGVIVDSCWAQGGPAIDHGDTAWVLLGAALVMLMTPGLAFFYGGLVRKKNILSVLMQCFMILCVISLQWVFFGYSLSFGPDVGGVIGNLDWCGLKGVSHTAAVAYAPTVPHQAFMIFQMMFAIITPGLIIGAFAERMRFSAFCLFTLLWTTLVYDPIAHWMWGNGFLARWGAVDFAGGIVVHVNAGMSALAAAIFLGRRQGFPNGISPPHNLPTAVLGAGLLWFGWFGFNAGSALSASGLAVSSFVATHAAGAAAGLMWAILDWKFNKKPTCLGMITGAIAGLAAVTPAAGYITCLGAIGIGLIAGLICWLSITFLKTRLGYDDSLDAFGVHGVGGIWGSLAVGLWATTAMNNREGLFSGSGTQFGWQVVAVAITAAYSFFASLILFKLVDRVATLRVTEHDERVGLDLTQHKEAAYTVID